MNILILHNVVPDGASKDELDNREQVEAIAATLAAQGHRVSRHAFSFDLSSTRDLLISNPPDLVFNLVESVEGVDRLIHFPPALLDSLRIPYTGAPADAMFTTTGKLVAKRMMRAAGIPTAPWVEAGDETAADHFTPGRYIVKSVWEHASFGMDESALMESVTAGDLRAALAARVERLGSESFAELFIEGREFNISILGTPEGPRALPPAEILFIDYPADKPNIVDYRAKWDEDTFEYQNTPRTFDFKRKDNALLRELKAVALRCWRLFGMRGYARVDFRVDPANRPYVLEINANPCLSPEAGYASAAERGGLNYDQMIAAVVQEATCALPRAATILEI